MPEAVILSTAVAENIVKVKAPNRVNRAGSGAAAACLLEMARVRIVRKRFERAGTAEEGGRMIVLVSQIKVQPRIV